jgi:BirA family biotin operon repressor/biotin-[acetyl-CoA-carboxylase] ligase
MLIGNKLHYFDTISSTNDYAKTLIGEAPEGAVILADEQTDGKGRFGKKWFSPQGGLWMSVILQPPKDSLITLGAGVAVCKTLHMNGILPGIKWPNDIMLDNKKIGGILTEIIEQTIILGIGLNLNVRSFPPKLKNTASSVFLETKKHFEIKMIFDLLLKNLDEGYALIKQDKFSELLTEWRHYTILLGQQVIIDMGEKSISGKVLDISNDGSLILMRTDGKIERVIGGVCKLRDK